MAEGKTVVVIASECLGNGQDDLGKQLMKAYLFSLSQAENLPQLILFYNTGAKLVAEGAETVEDLKKLEEAGVEIRTCGTCAGYFELKEKIAVGTITNMQDIVNEQLNAAKVVRP